MKLMDRVEQANWILDFAQRRPEEFEGMGGKEEKEIILRLESPIYEDGGQYSSFELMKAEIDGEEHFAIRPRLTPPKRLKKPKYYPAYPDSHLGYDLSNISEELWSLVEKRIIPVLEGKEVEPLETDIKAFTGMVYFRGKCFSKEYWITSPSVRLFRDLTKLIDGCKKEDFYKCADPKCQKIFYNPTKRKKDYCSTSCTFRHKAEQKRKEAGEEYRLEARIRQKFIYEAAKNTSAAEFREEMNNYLINKQGLSKKEAQKWFERFKKWKPK